MYSPRVPTYVQNGNGTTTLTACFQAGELGLSVGFNPRYSIKLQERWTRIWEEKEDQTDRIENVTFELAYKILVRTQEQYWTESACCVLLLKDAELPQEVKEITKTFVTFKRVKTGKVGKHRNLRTDQIILHRHANTQSFLFKEHFFSPLQISQAPNS